MEVLTFALEDQSARLRYDALFESCPGAFIQQSTLWAEVIRELGPDQPFFLLAEAEGEAVAGLPLYLFEGPAGAILTSVPQPGPLGGIFFREGLTPLERTRAYRKLLDAALQLADKHRCLTLSIITNPFDDDRPLYDQFLEPTVVLDNYTQYVRLDQPMRGAGGQKNNLVRAEKFGFSLMEGTRADLDAWYEIHTRRQTTIGAKPLDYRLFDNMLRVLGPRGKSLFLLTRHGDTLAAGTFYIMHRHVMDVFAISMDGEYAAHAPNALLADRSMTWGRDHGAILYNWQSSPGRQSGVYTHKKMWGSVEAPYWFATRIMNGTDRVLGLTAEQVAAGYPGHYLVPFAALEGGFDRRMYVKP